MATYTSTQTGNWNTDSTWGGGGHPSANDDVVNIAASHVVTYDAGDSAVTWGKITVTGTLTFPVDANSTMSFNSTGVLELAATGVLNVGTSTSTPIGAAYHCRIYWPQGASSRNVFTVANGGTINIYGDPAFYGSAPTADLNDDWSSGKTLYVAGDYTAKWAAGQKFWIHKNGTYSNYTTDSAIFTIDSIGAYDSENDRTPIVIVEAAPGVLYNAVNATSNWTSRLIMLSRNVELADPGTTLTVYYYNTYAERIRPSFGQLDTNVSINFDNAMFYGWDYPCYGGGAIVYSSCAFIDNNRVAMALSRYRFPNSYFISNGYVTFQSDSDIIMDTCWFGANGECTSSGTNKISNSFFIGNNYADGAAGRENEFRNTKFICNAYVSYGSTSGGVNSLFSNCDFWLNNVDISGTYFYSAILENCEMAGEKRALRVFSRVGNFLPLISGDSHWQTPDSGLSWILEAAPTSFVGTNNFEKMTLSPHKEMAVYCPSGANTLTFRIYPHGWTTDLTNTDVYIKVRFLTDTGNETAEVQTATATFNDDAWRSMSVTFTTGQAGVAYFNVYMTKYEASAYFLLDPVWTLS